MKKCPQFRANSRLHIERRHFVGQQRTGVDIRRILLGRPLRGATLWIYIKHIWTVKNLTGMFFVPLQYYAVQFYSLEQ